MVRGGNNKPPPISAVKAAARRNPAPKNFRPGAKPTTIVDDRPSQFIKGRLKAPDWLASKKTKHEKIPGTRMQLSKGGWPVRVVIADGKEFPAEKVTSAKKHLKKLAQQEQEKREIDSIINGTGPTAAAKAEVLGGATAALAAAAARKVKRRAPEAEAEAQGGKKARKEEAWKQRQQKLVQLHASSVEASGRQLVSDEWHLGEVVQRTSGRAWLRPQSPAGLPEAVLTRARAADQAVRSEFSLADDLLPALFGDVAVQGLSLQPGVSVRFKVYTDRNGAGACEVSALEDGLSQPVGEQPARGKKALAKRRRKAEAPTEEAAGTAGTGADPAKAAAALPEAGAAAAAQAPLPEAGAAAASQAEAAAEAVATVGGGTAAERQDPAGGAAAAPA